MAMEWNRMFVGEHGEWRVSFGRTLPVPSLGTNHCLFFYFFRPVSLPHRSSSSFTLAACLGVVWDDFGSSVKGLMLRRKVESAFENVQ